MTSGQAARRIWKEIWSVTKSDNEKESFCGKNELFLWTYSVYCSDRFSCCADNIRAEEELECLSDDDVLVALMSGRFCGE